MCLCFPWFTGETLLKKKECHSSSSVYIYLHLLLCQWYTLYLIKAVNIKAFMWLAVGSTHLVLVGCKEQHDVCGLPVEVLHSYCMLIWATGLTPQTVLLFSLTRVLCNCLLRKQSVVGVEGGIHVSDSSESLSVFLWSNLPTFEHLSSMFYPNMFLFFPVTSNVRSKTLKNNFLEKEIALCCSKITPRSKHHRQCCF